jgi:hypothetical protein
MQAQLLELALRVLLRILKIMNTHSYHREHLLYSRIGLGVFLR